MIHHKWLKRSYFSQECVKVFHEACVKFYYNQGKSGCRNTVWAASPYLGTLLKELATFSCGPSLKVRLKWHITRVRGKKKYGTY